MDNIRCSYYTYLERKFLIIIKITDCKINELAFFCFVAIKDM